MKKITRFEDLTPDPENLNRGTERGANRLEWSIERFGYARSIVVDAEGVVIAGNQTLLAASDKKPKIRVVQVDGDELVVVQRRDWSEEKRIEARSYGLSDNRVAQLGWDPNVTMLLDAKDEGVAVDEMYFPGELEVLMAEPPAPGGGEHVEFTAASGDVCSTCGQKIRKKR